MINNRGGALLLEATVCIISYRFDIEEFNINKLRSLNFFIVRINIIYTGGNKAYKADSNIIKNFKSYLLLLRSSRIMLRSNLWIEVDLVNSLVGTI